MADEVNTNWRLLNWDVCCSMSSEVENEHERVSRGYEYGLPWCEFIEDQDRKLGPMVQRWWDELTPKRQMGLLVERLGHLTDTCNSINEAIVNMNGEKNV